MRGWVCRLQLLLVLVYTVILKFKSCGTLDHILLSEIRDSPNLEGQVPVFISPWSRVARLYPQALGSLFVTSYGSQGYGGGIRSRRLRSSLYGFGTDHRKRRFRGNVFTEPLPSNEICSGSTILAFRRHGTVL
jgi:hypothetical protein